MGLALFNSEHRDQEDIAAFNAAATRASAATVPYHGRDDRWGRIAIYPVIDDGTLFPVPEGVMADIWSAFTRMVTPGFAAERMSAFQVASKPGDPADAGVERASVRPLRWTLTVNAAHELERGETLRTLVHEYAHLLTLDDDQLDSSATRCRTTRLQEGCLLADSTLKRFEQQFWDPYGGRAPDPDSQSSAESWRMYFEHTDRFLTVYAATNIVEDAAETFAEFVIRDRPSPKSGTWARKILFFWDDPEYVAIRAHIRNWFGPELPAPSLPVDDTHRG
ncbi:MAG TPA: hypothetical protein VNQ52_08935 [Microbacteriaceae bacterium]|nr:hypothetical protein [Microbacteriaceae bacterium]